MGVTWKRVWLCPWRDSTLLFLMISMLMGCPEVAPEEGFTPPVVDPVDYLGPSKVEDFAPVIEPPPGLYSDSIEVTMAFPAEWNGDIYYTLDGTLPQVREEDRYVGPLMLTSASEKPAVIVRALGRVGETESQVVNQSYVFRDAVLTQSKSPSGFPQKWGTEKKTDADYEMDGRIWSSDIMIEEGMNALTQLPSVVLNLHKNDLFEPPWGLYANPDQSGAEWERPTIMEWFESGADTDFSIDCGIRVQGGSSTENWKSPKLSFRLDFQEKYGPSKLESSLFPGSPVAQFDHLILDAGLNLTWIHPWTWEQEQSQYTRDIYMTEIQRIMGWPSPRGRHIHLYLNGLYWGLYWIHEYPDASFANDYFGNGKKSWDVLKHDGSTVVDGSNDSWNAMMEIVREGVSDPEGMQALEGFLDLVGFADYLVLNLVLGNLDWPQHNWYAIRGDKSDSRFMFLSWDAEMVMHKLHYNRIEDANHTDTPGEIFQVLRDNSEFRLLFADRVQHHLYGEGVFAKTISETGEETSDALEVYLSLAETVRSSLLLESARWGDYRRKEEPYTRDGEWAEELDWLTHTYFPQRREVVLTHFREAGLFPEGEAPRWKTELSSPESQALVLEGDWDAGEQVLFTLDGTDPREAWSGEIASGTQEYVEALEWEEGMILRARILRGDEWSAEARYPRWSSPWMSESL
jgi:hypothetical protein